MSLGAQVVGQLHEGTETARLQRIVTLSDQPTMGRRGGQGDSTDLAPTTCLLKTLVKGGPASGASGRPAS